MKATIRFSITLAKLENLEIEEFCDQSGLTKTELIRRATLAYVRSALNNDLSVEQAFKTVNTYKDAQTSLSENSLME